MAQNKTAKMIRRDLKVEPYEGTNEVMNRLMDEDDTVWIVQGNHGRVPVIADDEEAAKDRYVQKYARFIEAEAEEDEEVLEDA